MFPNNKITLDYLAVCLVVTVKRKQLTDGLEAIAT